MKQGIGKKKILVALSGGIDSAVSAYLLLKSGYIVEAAFMKNWSSTAGLKVSECPWLQDRQDALRVAAFLRIPLHTLDFEKQYADTVMRYFFNEYKAGRTPNPDVMCNKEIKFKLLYNWAMQHGFEFLATGHYAQIVDLRLKIKDLRKSSLSLVWSVDEFKDQTYFIYNIKSNQLPHLLFPVGGMKKVDVRKLAKKIKLPNADKKESMGLCFVGKIRLKDFLGQKLQAKKGKIILLISEKSGNNMNEYKGSKESKGIKDKGGGYRTNKAYKTCGTDKINIQTDENIIGYHEGLHNYTIGQRQGVSVGEGGPYYVVKKDLAKNILYVTNNLNDPALETTEVIIYSVNWIVPIEGFKNVKARYRHQGGLVPVVIKEIKKNEYLVKFKIPQKAIASGQSLVLYSGKTCLGGGVIA